MVGVKKMVIPADIIDKKADTDVCHATCQMSLRRGSKQMQLTEFIQMEQLTLLET